MHFAVAIWDDPHLGGTLDFVQKHLLAHVNAGNLLDLQINPCSQLQFGFNLGQFPVSNRSAKRAFFKVANSMLGGNAHPDDSSNTLVGPLPLLLLPTGCALMTIIRTSQSTAQEKQTCTTYKFWMMFSNDTYLSDGSGLTTHANGEWP
jgi:hypothetical protein